MKVTALENFKSGGINFYSGQVMSENELAKIRPFLEELLELHFIIVDHPVEPEQELIKAVDEVIEQMDKVEKELDADALVSNEKSIENALNVDPKTATAGEVFIDAKKKKRKK